MASTEASMRWRLPPRRRSARTRTKTTVVASPKVAMKRGCQSCCQLLWTMMSNSNAGSASQTTKRFSSLAAAGPKTFVRRQT